MAKAFRPNYPYSTPIELLIPNGTTTIKGTTKKLFPKAGEGVVINCSFKTYGGTETTTNDVYTVVNTAQVETWYRPDIKADCRVRVLATGTTYEVIGAVENIDMRNQFVKFKVQAIEGDA